MKPKEIRKIIKEETKELRKKNRELRKEVEKLKNNTNTSNNVKECSSSEDISRREFLKKTGLGAAALGAMSLVPGSALNIKDNYFNVSTGKDTLQQYFSVAQDGPVNIQNTNLTLNNNSLENVDKINGNKVSNLGGVSNPLENNLDAGGYNITNLGALELPNTSNSNDNHIWIDETNKELKVKIKGNVYTAVSGTTIPESAIARYDATEENTTGDIVSISDLIGSFDLDGNASIISSGINGQQTYRFDGSEEMSHSSTLATSDPVAVLAVIKQQQTSSNNLIWDGGSDLEFGLQDNSDGTYNTFRGGSGGDAIGSVSSTAQLIELHGANSDSLELYYDGSKQGEETGNTADVTGFTLASSAGSTSGQMAVDVGELVILQGFSQSDIDSERSRLSDKWGVTV